MQRKPNVKIETWGSAETSMWKKNLCFQGAYFSTGLVAILRSLKSAPLIIHGFDFGKGSHGHYFKRLTEDTCHDVTGEGFIMQQLERDGVVVRLTCLEALSVEEMDRECRVITLTPAANPYQKGCKKDSKGRRRDAGKVHDGPEGVLGFGGLPEPMELRKSGN
eukprot:scaffold306683_cov39-Prasinocladus_malaysianus.AAC.1